MAFVTVTYTFTNSTTADATQVNTNFQDLVDATSDGSIDFSVASVTCTSFSCTGNTTIGNATADDLTVTARLASDFVPKTTNTYSLGSSTLGYTGIYLGANSQTIRLLPSASMSATWTLTFPVSAGNSGEIPLNSGSGTLIWSLDPRAAYNYSLTASVNTPSANNLTIALKNNAGSDPSSTSPASFAFRNATATTGTSAMVSATAATSLVISSGSTLGHRSGVNEYIYVYAINNAGTVELAASSRLFEEGTILSTTAEGGAGAADSRTVIYSTTARSNVAVRLIGRLLSNQATAGTWASAISEISTNVVNRVFNSLITAWTSYTPTITGSGGNPTRASAYTETAYWRRVGSNMEIVYTYNQGNSAGAASGSGTYTWSIPSGFTVDTSIVQAGANTTRNGIGCVGAAGFNNGSDGFTGFAQLWDNNEIALMLGNASLSPQKANASNNGFGLTSTVEFTFSVSLPIVEFAI